MTVDFSVSSVLSIMKYQARSARLARCPSHLLRPSHPSTRPHDYRCPSTLLLIHLSIRTLAISHLFHSQLRDTGCPLFDLDFKTQEKGLSRGLGRDPPQAHPTPKREELQCVKFLLIYY